MDVKDINGANPLLFSKTAAINSAVAAMGGGFADLLGQTTQVLNAKVSAETKASDNYAQNIKGAEPKEYKKDKAEIKTKENGTDDVRKNARKEKGKKVEKESPAEENAQQAAVPVRNEQIKDNATAGIPAKTEVDVNNDVAVVAETDVAVSLQTPVEENGETVEMPNIIKNAESEISSEEQVLMPTAEVANEADTRVVKNEGAEKTVPMTTVEMKTSIVDNMSAPVVDSAVEELPVMEFSEETVSPEKHAVAEKNNVAAIERDTVLPTSEQASELAEKIGSEQQVKVVVTSEGEKTAYRTTQDLLGSRIAIDEAVKAAAEEVSSDDQTSVSVQPETQANASINQPSGNMPNVFAAPVQLADASADISAGAARTAELSAVNANASAQTSGVMSGSEFVAAARAEAANGKENAPTFKEVYKGMGKEAVEQIKVNITKSAVKGIDKIDVHLKPEELGRIEIKMQIAKDGKLQAHIISSRPETMDMLQKEVQSLEKAFEDAGFQMDENSLSFSFRDDGQAGQNRERNAELRSFIGNVFEAEADHLSAANTDIQGWVSDKGLNIRV